MLNGIPRGYLVFTFVREPLSIFMSGYAETVHRVTTWGGARSVRSEATTYTNVGCNSTAANETRFAAFIADILACRQMGYDTYHIWPQVTKLDVLPANRSFDFIGRVENLQEDWRTLMRRLGTQPSVLSSKNPASHNVDSCGKQIAVPSESKLIVLPLLCNMLRADYECLGYQLPAGCQAASDTLPRACSISATQSAVLARVGASGSSQRRLLAALVQFPGPGLNDATPTRSPGCQEAAAVHTSGAQCGRLIDTPGHPRMAFKVVHMTMFQDVKRKVLFCLPVKSGATLLRKVFSGLGGWNLQRLRRITPEVDTHFKVAVVRETLSRLSAAYAHAGHLVINSTESRSHDGFQRFLSTVLSMRDFDPAVDRHFQPQALACRPDLFKYDSLLRFETMQSDLKLLLQQLDRRASTQQLARLFTRYANCSNSSSCVAKPTPSVDSIDDKTRIALQHKYRVDEHWRLAHRLPAAGAFIPRSPSPDYDPPSHSSGKDEAAAHVRNLRNLRNGLSSDFLSNATFRKQPPWRPNVSNAPSNAGILRPFASLKPAEVRLSRCGSVIAPFGGHMLAAFEEHLRAFGNPIINTPSWENASFVTMRRTLRKHRKKALGSGYHHLVFAVDPADAQRLQASKPVLVRMNIRGAWRDAGNTNCQTYLQSLWNGWMAWILGELDITPRVVAIWTEENISGTWTNTMENTAFKTVSILERWPSLEVVMRKRVPLPVTEAQQLFDHIVFLTQSGIVNLDFKPRDMYVRNAQDQWQMRLGDIEFGNETGMLLDATAGCRLGLTLQLPVVLFACGPLRRHKVVQSFVGHAYSWLGAGGRNEKTWTSQPESVPAEFRVQSVPAQEGSWSSLVMKQCWPFGRRVASHTTGLCGLERPAVWESSLTKSVVEMQHLNTRLHVIMDGIMAKGGVCPDKYLFTKTNNVQGRNPSTLEDTR